MKNLFKPQNSEARMREAAKKRISLLDKNQDIKRETGVKRPLVSTFGQLAKFDTKKSLNDRRKSNIIQLDGIRDFSNPQKSGFARLQTMIRSPLKPKISREDTSILSDKSEEP